MSRNLLVWVLALGFGLSLAAVPLLAHHSFAAEFDGAKPVKKIEKSRTGDTGEQILVSSGEADDSVPELRQGVGGCPEPRPSGGAREAQGSRARAPESAWDRVGTGLAACASPASKRAVSATARRPVPPFSA